jgi:hypothetical protein
MLGFFVEIGHRELGPERTEHFSAAPRDRVIVGNANDEAPLAFEQLGWGGRDHAGLLLFRRDTNAFPEPGPGSRARPR